MMLLRAYLETLRRSDGKRVDLPPTGAFVPAISPEHPRRCRPEAGITCLDDRPLDNQEDGAPASIHQPKKGPLT